MKIQVDRIPAGGKRYEGEEPVASYEISYLDFQFKDPITMDIGAQVVSGNLVVSGKISTSVLMICSRCLKGFSRAWEDSAYHFDCQVIAPNQIIDLTQHIREDIIVGLPVKPLCREDCKGLCPACGSDWNVAPCECPRKKGDIRWSGLNKLSLE